jgi:hypothetical protein
MSASQLREQYDELIRSEDVILLLDWEGGSHAITGAGVGKTQAGRNWIGVSDPSDEGFAPHELDPNSWQEYQLQVDSSGYLYIPNYSVAGGRNARVYGMFALSVPEPFSISILALGVIILIVSRRSLHDD